MELSERGGMVRGSKVRLTEIGQSSYKPEEFREFRDVQGIGLQSAMTGDLIAGVRWSEHHMNQFRLSATLLLAAVLLNGLIGCGRKSDAPETAVGIPLAINGPAESAGNSVSAKDIAPIEVAASQSAAASVAGATENPLVTQLIKRANAAVVAGQQMVAIEAISQAIGIAPDDARLFRIRADVYVLQGENANARVDFTTALRISPKDADLWNYRGYFLMTAGLPGESLADFNQAIALNPHHAAALNNRGLLRLAASDFEAAEKDFSAAIDADRQMTDAWNNHGFSLMKLKRYDEALSDLQQAIRLDEKYINAWNNCGLVRLQREEYAEAVEAFSRAVELNSMDVRWLGNRRAAYLKLEDFESAQADADRIAWLTTLSELTQEANRDARNPALWIRRGRHMIRGEQFGAAIQDFTRALIVNPGNTEALTGRAMAWLATGDTEKAIMDCDESLVIAASDDAYSIRGDVWLKLGNLDQAIADYEACGRFDEMVAAAYQARADRLGTEGRSTEAAADLAKADEIRKAFSGTAPRLTDGTVELPAFPPEMLELDVTPVE